MFEVYSGTRPGRPAVLVLLTGGALLGALALAWGQARGRLALDEPVHVKGTPLIVRPPTGWIENPRGSGVFVKPVRKIAWGREVWAAERKVEFRYNNFFLQLSRLFQAESVSVGTPAEIGGWTGVQFALQSDGRKAPEQLIYRWVSTPWGGQISVEYTPLGEASHGDTRLLDAVCKAVEVDGSDLRFSTRDTAAYAGVSFAPAPDWEILGPQYLGGPGLCIQDSGEQPPRWGLAVFRRPLERGRQPLEVLIGEAASTMGRWTRPKEHLREDGAFVATVRNPDVAPGGGGATSSIWILAESPTRTAVVYALAPARNATLADNAAAELVDRLRFVSEFPR